MCTDFSERLIIIQVPLVSEVYFCDEKIPKVRFWEIENSRVCVYPRYVVLSFNKNRKL